MQCIDTCPPLFSGPIHAMVLEKTNAIRDWRELMGPTDPNKAREIEPNR